MPILTGQLMKRGVDFLGKNFQPTTKGVEIVPGVAKGHYAARWTNMIHITAAQLLANALVNIPNPLGREALVTRCVFGVTTASTGSITIDLGIGDGAQKEDNLIDGATGALGILDNIGDGGTEGLKVHLWAADEFLTIGRATGTDGNTANLAAFVLIEYIPFT